MQTSRHHGVKLHLARMEQVFSNGATFTCMADVERKEWNSRPTN